MIWNNKLNEIIMVPTLNNYFLQVLSIKIQAVMVAKKLQNVRTIISHLDSIS